MLPNEKLTIISYKDQIKEFMQSLITVNSVSVRKITWSKRWGWDCTLDFFFHFIGFKIGRPVARDIFSALQFCQQVRFKRKEVLLLCILSQILYFCHFQFVQIFISIVFFEILPFYMHSTSNLLLFPIKKIIQPAMVNKSQMFLYHFQFMRGQWNLDFWVLRPDEHTQVHTRIAQ